jgi:gamma-glutamylcyclotransferase (GGCT)/AIG2-like uncharacterized protein YtfP
VGSDRQGCRRDPRVPPPRDGHELLVDPPIVAVYGTLRQGERNHSLLEGAAFLGTGRIPGALHDVPRTPYREYPYPACLEDGPGTIEVEIYGLVGSEMLSRLDALERFDPDDVESSQYVRVEVPVTQGPVERAWAYVYRGPADELGEQITDGDWTAFSRSRERGRAP